MKKINQLQSLDLYVPKNEFLVNEIFENISPKEKIQRESKFLITFFCQITTICKTGSSK